MGFEQQVDQAGISAASCMGLPTDCKFLSVCSSPENKAIFSKFRASLMTEKE
jgi:hypothetical protein